MDLISFKNKYLGKQVEYHSYGQGSANQCVDLVNQYINEVLGKTAILGTNAKDFPNKYIKAEFDWIPNTPTGVPEPGDIIVWNGKVGGGAGHIAIVLSANVNSFTSVDQNWSQKERVTIETHNYTNVSGWLHPKEESMSDCLVPNTAEWKAKFNELVTKSSKFDAFTKAGYETPQQITNLIDDYKKSIENLKQEKKVAEDALQERRSEDNKLKAEMAQIHDTVQDWSEIKVKAKKDARDASGLEDLQIKYKKDLESWAVTEINLRAEITKWKALAEHTATLGDWETVDLINEVVNRLLAILKRKS